MCLRISMEKLARLELVGFVYVGPHTHPFILRIRKNTKTKNTTEITRSRITNIY